MNKKWLGIIVFLIIVGNMGFVSAKTAIVGTIYNKDTLETVDDADVTVDCHHIHKGTLYINTEETTSADDGTYSVEYASEKGKKGCNGDDLVEVTATKDGMSGSNSGYVKDNYLGSWDVGIVDVFLIPEFNGLTAGVALIGAGLGFILLRRKR